MTKIAMLPISMYCSINENPVNIDIKDVKSLILGKKPDVKLSTLDQIIDFFRRLIGRKTKQQQHNELINLFDTFISRTNFFHSQTTSLDNILDMEKNESLFTFLCCINTIEMTEKSQIKNYSFKIDSKKDQNGYVNVRFSFNKNEVSNFIITDNNRNKTLLDDGIFNYNQNNNTYSIKEINNNTLLDSVLNKFISKKESNNLPIPQFPLLSIDNKLKTNKATSEVGVNTIPPSTSDNHSQTNQIPEDTNNSKTTGFVKVQTTEQSTQTTPTNIDEFIQYLSKFKSIDEIINESERLTVGAGSYGTAYRFFYPYDGFVVKVPINKHGEIIDYDIEQTAHPKRTAKYLNEINGDGFAFSHLIDNGKNRTEVLISKYIDGHDIYEENNGAEEIEAFLNNKGFCCYDISSPGNFKKDSSGRLYVIDVDQVVEKPTINNPGVYSDYLLEIQIAIYLKNEIKELKKENEDNSLRYNRYIQIALGNSSGITTIKQKIDSINKEIHNLEAMLKLCENNKELREDESGRFKGIIDKLA
ncbi:MAG: hypothetical protein ACRC9O_13190 [Plesiomonas sp.]|uniref:hypothetical protein n=1 Tax=Plesiomonas sp. TaxID=2486279 RepID=UPI003F33D2C8